MKYGQIAGNTSINATIYRCFEHICEEDAARFVRKFREQLCDQDQVMHTFRELVLGGFLGSQGFRIRSEMTVSGKTPDWSIVDESLAIEGMVELVNFHIDRTTEIEIAAHWRVGRMWCGWKTSNCERLYPRIQEKASAYKELVEQLVVPYAIAVFGEFTADVRLDEVRECLFHQEYGLLKLYPAVSGALFFVESSGRYSFTYLGNPDSERNIGLPSGVF